MTQGSDSNVWERKRSSDSSRPGFAIAKSLPGKDYLLPSANVALGKLGKREGEWHWWMRAEEKTTKGRKRHQKRGRNPTPPAIPDTTTQWWSNLWLEPCPFHLYIFGKTTSFLNGVCEDGNGGNVIQHLSKLNIAPRHTPPTFLKTLIFFFGDIG